jgi:hypothetical protein
MSKDKQLCGIRLEDVLEKRRLDQALNAKEFAVLAGISYSMARQWFRLPGFPGLRGVVFWGDFVRWRTTQGGWPHGENERTVEKAEAELVVGLPPRAAKMLATA